VEEYDVVVVGAGPGGYLSAIRMAKLGAKVLVIESGKVGGECLNYACIPSKAILNYLVALEHGAKLLDCSKEIDIERLREYRNEVVEGIVRGVEHLFKRTGVKLVKDRVTRIEDRKVYTANGGVYRGEYVVLATGSRPRELPGIPFDEEYVWSSRVALMLPRRVDGLVVVGGGAAGLEIATIYKLLGAAVTVVEVMDRIAPFMDKDVSRRLRVLLARLGIKFYLGSKVVDVDKGDGGLELRVTRDSSSMKLSCDAVVITIGRRPNIELSGDVERLERDGNGFIIVDDHQATNVDYLFAVGDVAGPPLLAHKAYWDAIALAEYLYGDWKGFKRPSVIPSVIYSYPGAFSVGVGEDAASEMGLSIQKHSFPLGGLGAAAVHGEDRGFLKVITDEGGKILGIHGISNRVSELVGIASLAVELGLRVDELASVIYPHPTYSEAYWEIGSIAIGRGLHVI